jgi:hypothetical protein
MKMIKVEVKKIPQKYQLIISIGAVIIVFLTWGLTLFIMSSMAINSKEMSPFLFAKTFLSISFSIAIVPAAILGEYITMQWKRRKFLWRSVIALIALFSSTFMTTTLILLTLFDKLFSDIAILWQLPLVAICNSAGLITVAILFRSKRFKQFAQKYLGW